MAPTTLQQEVSNLVTFMSYNSTGMSTVKCQWINEICDENNLYYLSIQEHFKCTKSTDKFFRENYRDYYSYVIPGFRPPGQDNGRARAGLAHLSRKSLAVKKDRVVTYSYRIQAQVLNFPSSRILWINTYMPTDPQRVGQYDTSELMEVLKEVENILTNAEFDDVVWVGDLNWHMERNSFFSKTMKNFVDRVELVSVWNHFNVDYTHMHTDNKSVSTLDHFLINPRLLSQIVGAGAIHRGDNMSRHSPIWLRIDLGNLPKKLKVSTKVPVKPSWIKATLEDIQEYNSKLRQKLEALSSPDTMGCSDPHCTDVDHSQERDTFMLDILLATVETSHTALPLSGGRRVGGKVKAGCKAIPGWTDEVEPFRKESMYWHRVWLSEDRPNHGWLHATMVKKRTQYHYAVRRLKRKSDLIQAGKLFEASMQGDINLLKEMKSVRGGNVGQAELPETVAGGNGEEEIVEKFREVYSSLYNSAETDKEMEDLKTRVASLVRADSVGEVGRVTGAKVKEAVSLLKPRKMDVSGGFTSDALLNGPDILFEQLASIFRSWLLHGTVTFSLLACAFLPLLKSSLKDPVDTGSYRAIAGSSLILKLFEKVMLLVWGHLLGTDSLQFGFKADTSTTQCSWLVQEVMGHYLRNGTNPIMTVLDCSKAFHMCKYSIMFQKLLDTGMPPIVIRTLMFIYQQQYAWVKWGKSISSRFGIKNGTRQGSMASPALWSVYLDLLIKELRLLGVGCHVGGLFMGAVVYADDVLLMAPTRGAMQMMLDKCQSYAAEHNILFSTDPNPSKSKTKCIFVTGGKKNLAKPAPLILCGRELPWVSTATHLGHELHETGSMEHDALVKRAVFIAQSVELRESLGFASPVEVLTAMKVYCCSFYGSMLWDLGGEGASQVFNAWNTAVKLTWAVPRATRTYLVQQCLAGDLTSARVDIMARYAGFFRSLVNSPSYEVSVMAGLAGRDIRSTTGSNMRLLDDMTGLVAEKFGSARLKEELVKTELVEVPPTDQWRVRYLSSLLEQRQRHHYSGNKGAEEEMTALIDSLCVN